jgi:hypothetical protein
MDFRTARRSRQNPPPPSDPLGAGPRVFLTLAGGDEPAVDQRSLPRKAFVLLAVALYLLVVPLYWATAAQGATQDAPQAVLAKESDEDDDEPEDDDGPDTTGDNDTGTGRETAAANTDQHQPGVDTGASTRGETDADKTGATEQTQGTGNETAAANTDRPGLNTGVSTRGETDPGDHTGKTEQR